MSSLSRTFMAGEGWGIDSPVCSTSVLANTGERPRFALIFATTDEQVAGVFLCVFSVTHHEFGKRTHAICGTSQVACHPLHEFLAL